MPIHDERRYEQNIPSAMLYIHPSMLGENIRINATDDAMRDWLHVCHFVHWSVWAIIKFRFLRAESNINYKLLYESLMRFSEQIMRSIYLNQISQIL